jgi:hypothetical protein
MCTGSFQGVKRQGRGADHSPSRAEVKERLELYLYSPSEPLWPVIGETLPLPFTSTIYTQTLTRMQFTHYKYLKFGLLHLVIVEPTRLYKDCQIMEDETEYTVER